MGLYYYIVQFLTVIESASILILIKTLLYESASKFEFKNKNNILKCSAMAAVFSANILIAVSYFVEGKKGMENASVMLALLTDFTVLLISAGCLITVLVNGKSKRIKKEKAKTVTIKANELKLHPNIRPVPYLQVDEKETLQTAVWEKDGRPKTLIFAGGAVTGIRDDSEIMAKIIPHDTDADTYYVLNSLVTGKKAFSSYVINMMQALARLMFVAAMIFMNTDHIILKMSMPYPEGYPSVGLMGASIGVLVMSYAWSVSGKGKTAAGETGIKVFKIISATMTFLGFLSMINSFIGCILIY